MIGVHIGKQMLSLEMGDNQTAIQIYKDKGIWKDYVEDTPWSPFKRLVEITLGTNDPKEVYKNIPVKIPQRQ